MMNFPPWAQALVGAMIGAIIEDQKRTVGLNRGVPHLIHAASGLLAAANKSSAQGNKTPEGIPVIHAKRYFQSGEWRRKPVMVRHKPDDAVPIRMARAVSPSYGIASPTGRVQSADG